MNKKILSIITATIAVVAILPSMNLYALNTKTSLTANAAWSADGKKYYSGKSYYTGWHNIKGSLYFFEKNGTKRTNSWVYTDDKAYYVDENGKALKHTWKNISGIDFYFRSDGSLATDRWVKNTSNGNYYYFDKNGFPAISPESFADFKDIETTIDKKTIIQTKIIGEKRFTLVIDLRNWAQGAEPYQIITIADLYWNCYPKMYDRFVKDVSDKEDIMYIHIKPCGGVAGTGGHDVDINDDWLAETKDDYDAVTHELAHTLQNRFDHDNDCWEGWDGDKCECSDFIENFADYCRYVYAYKNGYYNDKSWNPEKIKAEDSAHHNSIKFLIWLDYKYSTPENDLIVKFSDVCRSKEYDSNNWNAAWTKIFEGSALASRTIDNVWNEYIYDTYFSDAKATTGGYGIDSQLIERYSDLRSKLAR